MDFYTFGDGFVPAKSTFSHGIRSKCVCLLNSYNTTLKNLSSYTITHYFYASNFMFIIIAFLPCYNHILVNSLVRKIIAMLRK